MNTQRKPSLEDLIDLQMYLFNIYGSKRAIESINELNSLNIAVFDNYVTSNNAQEWSGKIMVVFWNTSPNDYQVFTWDKNNKLKVLEQSEDMKVLIEDLV